MGIASGTALRFLSWAPLGQAKEAQDAVKKVADELHATPLLKRSKVIVPIPGTSWDNHLEKNIAAAALELPQHAYDRLSAVEVPPASLRG